uniref:Uncharacterized protein n=1 Tax=Thermorudis peleae TaxID=1382356 RepID=A0A831T9T0_9BACT
MNVPRRRDRVVEGRQLADEQGLRGKESERYKSRSAPSLAGQPVQTDRTSLSTLMHAHLRSPQRLREAFLLREIIGPPRAFGRVHRWPW